MADPRYGGSGVGILEPEPEGPGDPPRGRWFGIRGSRVSADLGQPFFRNAYALVLNTGLTGALGLLYWFLAARNYPDADIGRGSTAIAVMTLLSGLVAFNVTGTLNRFLPQSGRSVRRLLAYSYLLTSSAVLLLTFGFFATLDRWGPSFALFHDQRFRLWFLAAVVAAGIFTVQDGVLTGLRSAVWIPLENALFGAAKVVLLVLLADRFPADGVFLSWVVPMAVVLLPTNALIFGRLVPRHLTAAAGRPPRYTTGGIWRFFAADYIGALFMFATVNLVPVLVADDVPPATYAYFFAAWVMGSVLNLVSVNLATSLSVEGVYDRATLVANCRAGLVRALGLLLVAAVVVSLAAPYVLGAFGHGFLSAVALLQLMAFAALPRAVTEMYVGVLRAQGRARQIAHVQIFRGTLVVLAVVAALHADGLRVRAGIAPLTAIGVAVLASHVVVGLLVLPALLRFLRGGADGGPRTLVVTAPVVTAAAGRRPSAWRPRRPGWAVVVAWLLTAAAVPLFLVPLRGVDAGAANGFGLVSVLPVASLGAVALLTVAFGAALSLRRQRRLLLAVQVVLLVGMLHGVAALVEPEPRFPIGWVHAGFVDYISRTGTVAPVLDARFSWPGFFSVVAFVLGPGHEAAMRAVLTWTPLVTNLLCLLPLALLLRNVRATWRGRWFALWLFPLFDWVGQDYFSPQGFTYLLYLSFLAVLVTWFGGSSSPAAVARGRLHLGVLARGWRRSLPAPLPGELPPRPAGPRERGALLVLVIGLFTVATVSHQLTPIVMLFAVTALVLVHRCTARGLPLLLAVILVGWLSYMTVAYWSGHLGGLLSGLGNLTGNVSSSVTQRAQGGSPQHSLVLLVRVGSAVAVLALAAIGLLLRRLEGLSDRTLAVLLIIPFSAVLLQDYGGEIALRIYLFALPGACSLAAFAFFPQARGRPRPFSLIVAVVCALVFAGAFFVTRYGNESYEQIRPGEVAAVQTAYSNYGSGALVLYPSASPGGGDTPFEPLGYRDVAKVGWTSAHAPPDPTAVGPMVAAMRAGGPGTVLITTTGQEKSLQVAGGYPADWGERFRRSMAAAPGVRVVTENADAAVYALAGVPPGPHRPPGATPSGPPRPAQIGATPWTGIGLVFLISLLALLVAREVWRVRLAPGQGRRLLPLTLTSLPLLLGLAAVVVERLLLLGNA